MRRGVVYAHRNLRENGLRLMKPLSPVDAIAPAFSRTRTILTPPDFASGRPAPFRFWFFFKIAFIAALTNAAFYGSTVGLSTNAVSMGMMAAGVGRHRSSFLLAAPGFTAAVIAGLALAALLAVGFSIFLGWLWCRLRFTLLDLVLYRHGRVGLAWSSYGSQAWRYFGLLALVGMAFLLLLAVIAGPVFLHLFVVLRRLTPQEINSNPVLLFQHILPMYGIILGFGLVGTCVDAILQDFVLPPMAIEDAPLESAFGHFFRLCRERFGAVVLYLLLRFVLEIGLTWVGLLAVFLVLIMMLGGAGGFGFFLYRAFWHLGAGGVAVVILYGVVALLILIALYLLLMISLYGAVAVFRQAYALCFYGGFYTPLGNRLEPPAPASAVEGLRAEPPPTSLPPSLPPVPEPPAP